MESIREWDYTRLVAHKLHLEALLVSMAGQDDPLKPQLRAEHESVCAEINSRRNDGDE